MSFSIQNNTPSVGCIQWSNLNMAYKGITYAIVNGYTNAIYSYWSPSYPNNLIVTNEFPVLTSDECLIFLNKSGTATTVPTASVVPGDLLVPGSVTANAIAANTITGDKILAGTISASNIAAGTISSDKIAANAIGASVIAANCITGDKIVADAITAREIASKTITANEIVAGTITSAEIKAGTITATQIAAATIDATKIKSGTITTTQLASNVGAGLDISSNHSITLKADKNYVASRGENLVTNGTGLLGDNTNFSSFTFDGSDAYYSRGSFKDSTYYQTRISDELIPVEVDKIYKFSLMAKCNPYVGAKYYAGIASFDCDGNSISPTHHMYIRNTLTTLAQDLKPGDTKVYLTNATNWANSAGSSIHYRSIIFWSYKNSGGYEYPAEYYSRYYSGYDTWLDGSVDYVNNTITLKSPWDYNNPSDAQGIWRAGTKLSNGSSGSGYKYITMGNAVVPSTWTPYSGNVGGVDLTGTNVTNKFAPGTANVKLLFLNNREVTGSTVWYSNLNFGLDLASQGDLTALTGRVNNAEIEITPASIAQKVKEQRAAQIYKVRYIRDHLNGSTANTGNHWIEIKAIDTRGLNMASGLNVDDGDITGSSSITYSTGANPYTLTDGTIDDNYCSTSVSGSTAYIQIDLGMTYSNIENIIVWHYYADGRTYHKTKTEVSEDGVNWFTIFDSTLEREYVETKNGHSMVVNRGASSRTGIATFDDNGFRVENSDSNTYTLMDSGAFSVNSNIGNTIAEFSNNSIIPNLTSDGVIQGNKIYANNVASKSMSNTNVRFIYVDGATGNDSNAGTSTSRLKTVQHAIDYMLEDVINDNVTIYVYNSVPGFSLLGKSGSGIITFSLQDSAIISGQVVVSGVYNALNFTNETGSRKSTLKGGLIVYRCRQVDIYALIFRGVNGNSCNIWVKQSNYVAVNTCDLGGLGTILNSAIIVESSTIWTHNLIGSNIRDVVCQFAFSIACIAKYGSITVPDYTTAYHSGYDAQGRYQVFSGASIVKTPSIGWNPTYTPSARTTTWTFNKIWSDETLKQWSDKAELIQGYASIWNTGRYTGYMQMNDGFASIRETISGGTNLSGKVYIQRRTTSGNSTGSTLHLYASDGTHYTATINQGQGIWVNIDSAMVTKIMNGTVTYFYLRADADNPATYFKCESNAQIQITYTK